MNPSLEWESSSKFRHIDIDAKLIECHRTDIQLEDKIGRGYVIGDITYPSVTTVLSDKKNIELENWKAAVGETEAAFVSRLATDKGTRYHTYCEQYLKNNVVKFNNIIDKKYFDKIKSIFDNINDVYLQEFQLYSDYFRIAGTLDLLAKYNDQLSVIDFKTSNRIRYEDDIEDYFIQMFYYSIMVEERFKIVPKYGTIIMFVDGDFPSIFQKELSQYKKKAIQRRVEFYEKYRI